MKHRLSGANAKVRLKNINQPLGKTVNITNIQAHAPTTEAEEYEIDSFCASIREGIDHTPKQDMLLIICDWKTKVEINQNQMLLANLD